MESGSLVRLPHDVIHGMSEESEERLERTWPTDIAEWTRISIIARMTDTEDGQTWKRILMLSKCLYGSAGGYSSLLPFWTF